MVYKFGIGGKKKDEWQDIIGTMPSLTEEQATVSTPLSEYLSEAIAGIGAAPTFAEWAPGATPPMFGGPLAGATEGVYAEALTGAFPEEYYQKAIYKPAMTEWMEDIMPTIKESYVATGAITGTEVGERLGKEGRRLGESLAGVRATLGQQAKERALKAAGGYQEQYFKTLELAYKDYIKQYPDTAQLLQSALNYLNIPMMAAYQIPEEVEAEAEKVWHEPKMGYTHMGGRLIDTTQLHPGYWG